MGGTAIFRHTVVLGDLNPGTTYRDLLTAADARGRVFQARYPCERLQGEAPTA